MKGRRRNADEEQAACQTPFQFIEFSCDQLAHSSSSFLCQTKSSRPIRDESHSFVFPPNFIYLSPSIPYKVLTNPWLCIGSSREDLLSLQPAKLRNALQHLIHARSHSPDSLCCHQTAYSFLHRFVVCTLSSFRSGVKGFFIFWWSLEYVAEG